MSTQSESLQGLMRAALPPGGFVVSGGRELFMEVMDTTSSAVWMSAAAVPLAAFDALELEEPFVKTGIGRAAMDMAAFAHSPGALDAPVRERIIDGHRFIHVATPVETIAPIQPEGAMQGTIDKAHVLGFEPGRSVSILTLPGGDFVEVVGDTQGDESRVLPPGGSLGRVRLTEPWIVSLPTPTQVFFWWSKSMRSFQGPVTLPSSAT